MQAKHFAAQSFHQQLATETLHSSDTYRGIEITYANRSYSFQHPATGWGTCMSLSFEGAKAWIDEALAAKAEGGAK